MRVIDVACATITVPRPPFWLFLLSNLARISQFLRYNLIIEDCREASVPERWVQGKNRHSFFLKFGYKELNHENLITSGWNTNKYWQ